MRLTIAPLGTGRPKRLAGGAFRGKIDALFREKTSPKALAFNGPVVYHTPSFILGGAARAR